MSRIDFSKSIENSKQLIRQAQTLHTKLYMDISLFTYVSINVIK